MAWLRIQAIAVSASPTHRLRRLANPLAGGDIRVKNWILLHPKAMQQSCGGRE